MERRPLGNTGERISAIGLGCAGLSEGYGAADDSESLRTLAVAVENGVNFFDTSDAYGTGHNEELLRRALKERPERVIVATKFGLVRRPGHPAPVIDNSPEYVRTACEASLRRLGTDVLDLYFVHRRNPTVPIEELIGAMSDLVKAGKVRYLGLSEVSSATIRRAHAVHPLTAVQSEYSLWTRGPEAEVLNTCSTLGITFIASCPLGRAFLTGTMSSLDRLDDTDLRRRVPRFQGESLQKNISLLPGLEQFAGERGVTCAQVALAWLLRKHPHVVPIPGTKRWHHVLENAAAADIRLSTAEMQELEALFPTDAITGARYPAPAMAGIEVP